MGAALFRGICGCGSESCGPWIGARSGGLRCGGWRFWQYVMVRCAVWKGRRFDGILADVVQPLVFSRNL